MSAGLVAYVVRRRRYGLLLLLPVLAALGAALLAAPGPKPPKGWCGTGRFQARHPQPVEIAESEPTAEPAPWTTDDAFFLQIVGDRVYWNENSGLWSAALDRSDRPTHHVSGWVLSFVVEGDRVTYSSGRDIRRARLDGRGAPETLVTEWEDPIDVVSDGKHLYYTMFKGHDLMRADWNGGGNRRFAQGGPSFNVVVDDRFVYVAEYLKKGRIVRYPKSGGRGTVLASGIKRPVGLTQDADHLYFPVEGDGTLRRVAKRGGGLQVLATRQMNHDILAVDDAYVYWGDWGTNTLQRTRKDGTGAPEILARDRRSICGVAVNDRYIAFTTEGRLEIIPKP
jgi:hypothetical protein